MCSCDCFFPPGATVEQGPVTRVHGLIGWDNKGALQHIAKMNYMTERADRLDRLGVSVLVLLLCSLCQLLLLLLLTNTLIEAGLPRPPPSPLHFSGWPKRTAGHRRATLTPSPHARISTPPLPGVTPPSSNNIKPSYYKLSPMML